MNKISSISSYVWLVLFALIACNQKNQEISDEPIVIDERDQKLAVKKIIPVDSVWAGHRVGFSMLTHKNRQYIAYYDKDRHMTVGQRNLDEDQFELHQLPVFDREDGQGTSTKLGWDSHNFVTIDIDSEGYLHLAGNMHVHPITYFRGQIPNDISSLKQEMEMVGPNEERCTYPHFMKDREGRLLFHYRDGGSGNGNEIYNIYDVASKEWTRLLDSPLTDGKGEMNAYASQPALMEDNWYHMYWVWRDTPDCATNHDLSYIKSPDMINWYDAFGNKLTVPVTIAQKSVIVDPVPPKGGIINLAAKLCLDENNEPLMAFHKYDESGNLQFYVSKIEEGAWQAKQVTNWDYRWEFSGGGSIPTEVRLGDFNLREDGNFELGYKHIKYGEGMLLLDKDLNTIGEVLKPESFGADLNLEGDFEGLEIRNAQDLGQSENGKTYRLKWETLPPNRDKAYPEPWPNPSVLYLYELE